MSNHPDSPATVIRTTSDVNFEQAQHIYAIAAWMTDAVGILEELCFVIGDHTSSWNKLLEKASFIKKFVIPLFSDTIITITAAAKNLSSIPGSKYVRATLEHQNQHNVICSARTIYRLLERHANGNAISGQFTGKGRPPTISDADMKQIAQSLEVEVGKTYTGSDVELMIKKTQAENVESDGFKPIIEKSISRWTVKNYTAMLAKESNIAILQSYISKSNTRYAAENSIRGSVATLGVIATTYFITIDKENNDIRAEIKSLLAATRKMYDMVTDYFGSTVYPVEPYLLYSTDDTTKYIFEGTKQAFVPYVLTSTSSVSKHSTNALYKCKDNQSMSDTHKHQIHLCKERLSQNQRIESERKKVANHKHQASG